MRTWLVLVFVFIQSGHLCIADEGPAKTDDDKQSKRRLELMQSTIDGMKVSSSDIQSEASLKFVKTPLLRYNDPTRQVGGGGLLDAGVWRLGETGRPTALATLEIYGTLESKTILSYEFVTLVPLRLTINAPRGPTWNPARTDLKMAPLADALKPADSPKARLVQMRQICRRFAVRETMPNGDKVECRLLTQPIDRYADEKSGITDGAIFAFANGTNPEVALLLEASSEQWLFGALRLSSAALLGELDGKTFYEAPSSFTQTSSAPYIGVALPIKLEE